MSKHWIGELPTSTTQKRVNARSSRYMIIMTAPGRNWSIPTIASAE